MPDHIHLLIGLPPSVSVSTFVHDLKCSATKYLQSQKEDFPLFDGWSRSYCALSYSIHEKQKIINYIMGQKEHHKHHNYEEEIKALLHEFMISYDEKYLLSDSE
jgi:putative transposase